MPEKPATVAAYAAAASLAAVTFFYVIGPNYMLDRDHHDVSGSDSEGYVDGGGGGAALFGRGRKHTIVGLVNVANDCFMNSTLQALAPLYDLRLYLIRELHRRETDGREIYESLVVPDPENSTRTPASLVSLQQAPVTQALKQMLDALNERPIYRKTATIQHFVWALERAFQTGINRNQQDAQEFLQIVLERIYDEYKAGERVRNEARRIGVLPPVRGKSSVGSGSSMASVQGVTPANRSQASSFSTSSASSSPSSPQQLQQYQQQNQQQQQETPLAADILSLPPLDQCVSNDLEPTPPAPIPFPFLGKLESQVECRACGYKPKPRLTSFVNLTLQIPQHKGSATLGSCLDTLLMTEYIDDYRCDRCALVYVLEKRQNELLRARPSARQNIENQIEFLKHALNENPEDVTDGIDMSGAPKRQIARTTRIVEYPRVLAIHLSRSIFGAGSAYSTKNATKVSFPETLKLGRTLLSKNGERKYRLVSIVCHKGSSHNSGHYESMRRCVVREPVGTKVNEEVWRWVGYKSRSRTVSRAHSMVRGGGGGGDSGSGSGGANGQNGRSRSFDTGKSKESTSNTISSAELSSSPDCQDYRQIDPSTATTSCVTTAHALNRPDFNLNGNGATLPQPPSMSNVCPGDDKGEQKVDEQTPRSPSAGLDESQWVTVESPANPATNSECNDCIDNHGKQSAENKENISTDGNNKDDRRVGGEEQEVRHFASRLRRGVSRSTTFTTTTTAGKSMLSSKSKEGKKHKKHKAKSDKWFRVSDEKVKQCKTSDVLGMQKEVYMLFYELEE